MKKNLRCALASYSGLASSILLLTNHTSEAQIVYVDPADIVLHDGEVSLDLDNNGFVDFNFIVDDDNSTLPGAEIVLISGQTGSFMLGPNDPDCSAFYSLRPQVVKHGQEIKNHGLWIHAGYSTGAFCYSTPNCNHVWSGKDYKFVGVRFGEDNSHRHVKHYGWIRVSVSSDCSSITIHDWAYNSVANQSIKAGQTARMSGDEGDSLNDLQIFSSGNTVHIQNNFMSDNLRVEIFNNLGQLVKSEKTSEENSFVEMTEAAAGIYFVKVAGNELQVTQEVLIEQ